MNTHNDNNKCKNKNANENINKLRKIRKNNYLIINNINFKEKKIHKIRIQMKITTYTKKNWKM